MKPFGSKRRNKNQNLRDAIRVAAIASAEQSSETAAPIGPSAPTTPGESGVVGSGALEAGVGDAETSEAGAGAIGTVETEADAAESIETGTGESGPTGTKTVEADGVEAGAVETDRAGSSTTGPSTTEPDAGEPSTTEPSTTEPDAIEPSTTKPSTTEPSTTQPDAIEPSTTKPSTTDSDASGVDSHESLAVETGPSEGSSAVPGESTAIATSEAEPGSEAASVPAPAFSIDDTPLAREIADLTRRRTALAAEQLPLPSKTRVFTVANQKGGVGKTTTPVNLAAALARAGARVLVVDLDPQGNASTALGVDHRAETPSVYDVVINDEPIEDVIQLSPEFPGLYCLPATIHLAGAEIELVSMVAREQRLRTSLHRFLADAPEPFHYVFIDCPPSLGLLTINAFVAASEVLIPIQCEYYALEGLSQLLNNISLIERHLNPTLTVSTILLTMFDSRTNLANQVAQDVRDHFPDQVLPTPIPRSVRISEAPSYGQTVITYDTNSAGSLSYREAAAEMARRGAPE